MEKEELFRGTFILDGTPMTKEEQRKKVFEMMKIAGVEVPEWEKDSLIIDYEGATDDNGISETQVTEFRVYRNPIINMFNQKIEQYEKDNGNPEMGAAANAIEMEKENSVEKPRKKQEKLPGLELESLQRQLKDLKDFRAKLVSDIEPNKEKRSTILNSEEYGSYAEEISDLDNMISKVEEEKKELAKEYEKSYKKMEDLIKQEEAELNQAKLLSEEEINQIKEKYDSLKLAEHQNSLNLMRELEIKTNNLIYLKNYKTKKQNALNKSEALGLDLKEYEDLTSTLRKTNIMNAILKEKGLDEIISKKANERTKEEKELLKNAREDILKELAEYKKNNKEQSALDAIEILYSMNVTYNNKGNAKVMKLSPEDIESIKGVKENAPIKVVKPVQQVVNYAPERAPEDMMEEPKEKITIYKDSENDDYYASSVTLARLNMDHVFNLYDEININGLACYPISKGDYDFIYNNRDNEEAPYRINLVETNIEKENTTEIESTKEEKPKEKRIIYKDTESGIYYASMKTISDIDAKYYGYISYSFNDEDIEKEINGVRCYPLKRRGVNSIKNENVSEPYDIDIVEINIEKENTSETELTLEDKPKGKRIIYKDAESGEYYAPMSTIIDIDYKYGLYVRKPVFEIDKIAEEIDGVRCYPIEQVDSIKNFYEIAEINLEKENVTEIETTPEKESTPEVEKTSEKETTPKIERMTAEEIEKRILEGLNRLLEEQKQKNREEPNIKEKITIYKGKEKDDYYASRVTLERFGIGEKEDPIELNGIKCYRLESDEVESILNNKDNETAPYLLNIIDLEKTEKKSNADKMAQDLLDRLNALLEEQKKKNREIPNVKEKITVYKDAANDVYYVSRITLDRFDTKESGESVEINGIKCYPISSEVFNKVLTNSNSEYSPFILNVVETGNKNETKTEPVVEDENTNTGESNVTPPVSTEPKTNESDSEKEQPTVPINNESKTENESTESNENDSNRKYHVEEIIEEITSGLTIKANDAKKYTASNINVREQFKEELHSGNYAYNIVHIIPNISKAVINFGKKLSGRLLLSDKSKEAMQEVEKRLDNLEVEKLEVLFNEYKGYQLKVDMNNQINALILERLKKYIDSMIEVLNQSIKHSYANLFVILDQVKELEKKENKTPQDIENRNALMKQAAYFVRNILESRKAADNYISSGIEGISQEYEEVSKKYPYVGLSFAKSKDFDNKLQKELAEYGKGLNKGLEENNYDAIVNNFVQLETCYHNNTKISKSIFGNRSTGKKHHGKGKDSEFGQILDDYYNTGYIPEEIDEGKSK